MGPSVIWALILRFARRMPARRWRYFGLTPALRFSIVTCIELAWVWRANLYVSEFFFDCAAGAAGRFG
jgi:hypothetical protein